MIPENVLDEAVEKAVMIRDDAYAPYSEYQVGACVIVEGGDGYEFFTGFNIENANYTNTSHAEQNAVNLAVKNGHTTVVGIAVATAEGDDSEPCGLCQQHLAEFASDDCIIAAHTTGTDYTTTTLGECGLFRPDF